MRLQKKRKNEMKSLASLDHDSILRDDFEALKHFSWETVYFLFRVGEKCLYSDQAIEVMFKFIVTKFVKHLCN